MLYIAFACVCVTSCVLTRKYELDRKEKRALAKTHLNLIDDSGAMDTVFA